jgi:hypothetical protein
MAMDGCLVLRISRLLKPEMFRAGAVGLVERDHQKRRKPNEGSNGVNCGIVGYLSYVIMSICWYDNHYLGLAFV